MPKIRLTQRFVDTIRPSVELKKQEWFDIEIKGFYLEVRSTGGKTYRMRLKDQSGRLAVVSFGDACCISFVQARSQAKDLRARAYTGTWQVTSKPVLQEVNLTFECFVNQHYIPYAKQRKRSLATDISVLKNHLLPTFGSYALGELTKVHVVEFHTEKRSMGYAPATVDRMVVLLRFALNLAVKWGLLSGEKHPVKNFEFFNVPNARERYLVAEEVDRLVDALKASNNKDLLSIVRGLLLTGCRRGEILNARWRDIDMTSGVWVIPITKQGRPHQLPLSSNLKAYLSALPSKGSSEYLFPSPVTGRPYKSIFYSWHTARCASGMPELRIHDLRHSFASFLVNGGRSLYEVQRILGHTTPRTTQRYAHLSMSSLSEAMEVAKQATGTSLAD